MASILPGCRGGDGASGPTIAAGGFGGGALYFAAGQNVMLNATVNAGGEGGRGGDRVPDTSAVEGGGGGGGAGGLIVLEGLGSVNVSSSIVVSASGGGGGGGAEARGVTAAPGAAGDAAMASVEQALGGLWR